MVWRSYGVRLPTSVIYGVGASAAVGSEVRGLGKRALLVSDSVMGPPRRLEVRLGD